MGPARRAMTTVLAAVVGLLVLGGCVRVDGELTVHGEGDGAPGTVSGTMLVAVSNAWAVEQGTDPAGIGDAIAEELAAAAGSGVTGVPYDDAEYTGTTLTFDQVPIDRLSRATDGALAITRDGGRWVVSGDLSVLDEAAAPWTVRVSVTLPAEVGAHNGTLDGRTVTWQLDQDSADPTISAVAGAAVPWYARIPAWLVVATAVAGAGAAVAWWLSRRQRRRDDGPGGDSRGGGAVAAMRERQARARGVSTDRLDDLLGPRGDRTSQARMKQGGPRPRRGRR